MDFPDVAGDGLTSHWGLTSALDNSGQGEWLPYVRVTRTCDPQDGRRVLVDLTPFDSEIIGVTDKLGLPPRDDALEALRRTLDALAIPAE